MSGKRSYLAAAFNARPFGMPVPPNWFGLAAFGLLGALVDPGFWLIGMGLEGLYLWTLARHPRFQAVVDARGGSQATTWDSRYAALLAHLDDDARELQHQVETQAAEIADLLKRTGASDAQIGDVRQMAWLHLRLLAARASFLQVLRSATSERERLQESEQGITTRLGRPDIADDLRRSLEQQLDVIRSRRAAHADAGGRREIVEAELERLRQQVSLVREQALLATEESGVASSLDALSASLNEANRWLRDQKELFAGLDDLTSEPPPADILRSKTRTRRKRSTSE